MTTQRHTKSRPHQVERDVERDVDRDSVNENNARKRSFKERSVKKHSARECDSEGHDVRRPAIPQGHKGRVRRKANENPALSSEESRSNASEDRASVCLSCGGELLFVDETRLCPKCNSESSISIIKELSAVIMAPAELDRGFIECPGATLFDEATGEPLEGAVFEDDINGGYAVKHLKWPVFPPGHKKRRLIPTEAYGKIRRCRACQDYTVRMCRKEGADFCAPSARFPRRKHLKSVDLVSHRQPL